MSTGQSRGNSHATKSSDLSAAVDIDLGTAYSCVAIYQNGRIEIIPNEQGNRITPSYVAFNDRERLIGDETKKQVTLNSHNTIFDVKRLIGRKFDDPIVQSDMKRWPFKVIADGGRLKIEVKQLSEKNFATGQPSAQSYS